MRVLLLIFFLVWSAEAKNFAVIVGIDHYTAPENSVTTLKGACNDAKIFRKLLIRNGFESENITLLLEENATKKDILIALRNVSEKLQRGRNDKFFYFHAGHGAKLTKVKGIFADLSKTAVLLPHDVNTDDAHSFIITQNDLVPLFKVIDQKITFGMLIFDSCYSQFAYRSMGDTEERGDFQARVYTGEIAVDPKNFQLNGSSIKYPYSNLISLSASDAYTTAKEDTDKKRGVFSMALNYCLEESSISTNDSLKMCLDRKYSKQVYVFKKPKDSSSLETVFTLYHKSQISSVKAKIQTNIPLSRLGSLSEFATFVRKKDGLNDLELIAEGKNYKLLSSPDRVLINTFYSKDALKKYLSNYRFIYLQAKKGASLDVKVSYANLKGTDTDCVPTNTDMDMTITASNLRAKKIALFTLNQEGKLFMIEPNGVYSDFKNGMSIRGRTTSDIGTDFVKVMVFEKENGLANIKVNERTGEVIEDSKQIETILRESKNNPFYGVVRRVITSKNGECR